MRIKQTLILVVAFSLLLSNTVNAIALREDPFQLGDTFTDTQEHTASNYIEDLRLRGVISGKESGTFAPDDNISRAELTKIALESFSPKIRTELNDRDYFSDIESPDWFSYYVNQAKEESVVIGYDDQTFKPNQNINRVEALKILLEASGLDLSTTEEAPFIDVDLSAWYGQYVNYSFANFIDWGDITKEGFKFRPGDPATRGEVAIMASVILEIKEREQLQYNSTFTLLNEEQSQPLNEEYGLSSDNLWWAYINKDYGFSLNLPSYIAFYTAERGQFYPTTFFEEEDALYLTLDTYDQSPFAESTETFKNTLETIQNNEIVPIRTKIDFGSAETEEELISTIEARESDCTITVEPYYTNGSEDDTLKRFFFKSIIEDDIGQNLECGNRTGLYDIESKTFIYYKSIRHAKEFYFKGDEEDVFLHLIQPYNLTLFRYKNNYENLFQQNYPDNILGNLPKPVKMYFDSENDIFALSTNGERISLNLPTKILSNIEYDRYEHGNIFFDKISNRIFFIEDESVKYYDISNDEIITTPITVSLGEASDTYPFISKDENIAGAYGDYIVLEEYVFRTLNIHTGEELEDKAITWQSEYSQGYSLFLNGKAYELILESESSKSFPVLKSGGLYTRSVNSSGRYLGVYLKEIDDTYDELVDQMTNYDLATLLTSLLEEEENYEAPSLLLEIETNLPEHIDSFNYQPTFKVRNLFKLDDNRVAVEVDNSVVVIDLENYTAELVEDLEEITDLLDSAMLWAPPISNNYDFAHEPYCKKFFAFNEESIAENDTYISCLE